MEMFSLPCRTVTDNPILAAEMWAEAFYEAKDVLAEIKPMLEAALSGKPVRNYDEAALRMEKILGLGEK